MIYTPGEMKEMISNGHGSMGGGSETHSFDDDDDDTTYDNVVEELAPIVNQKTHMVYKDINKIENMEIYVSLKSLWIRFRNIKKIQNLEF
jgi:hypothetical protein